MVLSRICPGRALRGAICTRTRSCNWSAELGMVRVTSIRAENLISAGFVFSGGTAGEHILAQSPETT